MSKVETTIIVVFSIGIGVAYYLWQTARTVWEPLQGVMT